ncbi:sulfurtransferase complex subunit TusB [Pseudomonas petrae]|uniref:Sulfurtransferase complex subunit TusB n=1 Tax=Pseudomonas petrae TaxID=2912190 RepID=A0ABS9I7F8_9PSED|nr:sulfurtransferase complex subunit TusB [Pseudomonas petrae]MCF7534228.1 sulfurtransferase complex subunit TusB [Pseudomonas petrae]MCF7539730.1 sulfurtransferase complex subunit TusB [Pseudomonas petrae]MCF7543018.1 sulfurtransferase complex subunit TusB [Pseudomonas petrae]MCF7558018.1 sulfurtransferase complex subunit TusB [Pseudomonas petrae]
MATLHVLSHSPFTDSRLSSCLRVLGSDDAIFLCGDASYALRADTATAQLLSAKTGRLKLFVLDEDATARNIALPDWAQGVDYAGFVALSVQYDKVNTWL